MASARELFPVFSGLHLVSTAQEGKRKSAKKPEPELLVTGNVAVDLETALRAIAFLVEFVEVACAEGLRKCADTVREFRRERAL